MLTLTIYVEKDSILVIEHNFCKDSPVTYIESFDNWIELFSKLSDFLYSYSSICITDTKGEYLSFDN